MPSPFPGMDPYLEAPRVWPDLHHSLITHMREDLQSKLSERYFARIERRMVLEPIAHVAVPDLSIVSEPRSPTCVLRDAAAAQYVTSFLKEEPMESTPPPQNLYWIETEELEAPQGYVEIRDPEGEVVTVIEALSPSNKAHGHARNVYLRKQKELLTTSVNLVELDLLRSGLHTLAVPADYVRPAHYRVCIRQGHRPRRFGIIDFSVRDALAPIPIPLRPEEPSVSLDLPGVLQRCYDAGAYARQIDYTQPPLPLLDSGDEAWADALLREKELRR